MMKGKAKLFNEEKGFGFIAPEEGKDIFVHISGLDEYIPKEGDTVEFDVEDGKKGAKAVNVKII